MLTYFLYDIKKKHVDITSNLIRSYVSDSSQAQRGSTLFQNFISLFVC